jgi:galactokinase
MRYTTNKTLVDRVSLQFQKRFGHTPQFIVRAPGRTNLLGEHVDYNDGFVMPAAIDRATYLAVGSSKNEESTIIASDFSQEFSFTRESQFAKNQPNGNPIPDWGLYPAGVANQLIQNGNGFSPMQAVFTSDIPMGSGLSSSASVEVAFLTAWLELTGLSMPLIPRAQLCQRAENQYVGVNCGIMDQFSSVCGVEDRLLQLDCRSLEWNSIPLPGNVAIVIADTKVRRKLVSGEYNLRRQDCEEAVKILQSYIPGVRALRDIDLPTFNQYSSKLPERVEKRARHIVEEITRTMIAKEDLSAGNIENFGLLMNECHRSLRDLYEVSCLELNIMAEIAQSLKGCLGSRLTGAGFGGCTVSLVESDTIEGFKDALSKEYLQKTEVLPDIYVTKASRGAEVL